MTETGLLMEAATEGTGNLIGGTNEALVNELQVKAPPV